MAAAVDDIDGTPQTPPATTDHTPNSSVDTTNSTTPSVFIVLPNALPIAVPFTPTTTVDELRDAISLNEKCGVNTVLYHYTGGVLEPTKGDVVLSEIGVRDGSVFVCAHTLATDLEGITLK